METRKALIFSILILICQVAFSDGQKNSGNNTDQKNGVMITCSEQIEGLAGEWIEKYQLQNPGLPVRINPQTGTEKLDMSDELLFITENDLTAEHQWKMAVGRFVLVPVINVGNPYLDEIYQTGISKRALNEVFTSRNSQVWNSLVSNGENKPLNIYIQDNPVSLNALKNFLEINDLGKNVKLVGDPEILRAELNNDQYAIAFCNLTTILNDQNFRFLPIDRNENGKLDYMENIYQDVESLSRGIWIGKYPKELTTGIYAVSAEQPRDENQIALLNWILTSGQKSLESFGISELVYNEVQSKLDKIENKSPVNYPVSQTISVPKLILFIIAALLLLGILMVALFRPGRKEGAEEEPELALSDAGFNEQSIAVPGGLFYDRSHTWAYMEKDGAVKVGIDDFMQHITGPITRVEMKKAGEKVKKGEVFLSLVQKGKQLHLYAPVSGTILEYNRVLDYNTTAVNTSPYSDGWIYRIEPANWLKEIPLLNMAAQYKNWMAGEFIRLKEFLANALKSNKPEFAIITLQDGGSLKSNILEEFGPEIWEEFQTRFIDSNK